MAPERPTKQEEKAAAAAVPSGATSSHKSTGRLKRVLHYKADSPPKPNGRRVTHLRPKAVLIDLDESESVTGLNILLGEGSAPIEEKAGAFWWNRKAVVALSYRDIAFAFMFIAAFVVVINVLAIGVAGF